jgi:replication-associated recombination protein RarA
MIEQKLFWHKFRPNTIENQNGKIKMILLPRIKKIVSGGTQLNMLFYGSPGLGKTTITNILTEDTDCLRINCRMDSLDVVRTKLHEHCTKYSVFMGNKQKTVWLEEFDGASWQMREALRPMIEVYIDNVRFLATANSLANFTSDQDKGVLSRFNLIKFDPIDDTEKEFLRKNQVQFLKGIANKTKTTIATEEIIEKIINLNFPDFRKSVQHLQELSITQDASTWEDNLRTRNEDLYEFLLNGTNNITENYYYVIDNYRDNTQTLLKDLSRPLFQYLLEKEPKKIQTCGPKLLKSSKEHNAEYLNTMDPEIHLFHYLTEIKEILKNN